MADLQPGRMETPGRWSFQDSGGWRLLNPTNTTTQLIAEPGWPWPGIDFRGTVVDAALEYRLPAAPPATCWSLTGFVQYDGVYNSGGPISIAVLDERGVALASFTQERGPGPWGDGHRQALRLNGFVFYVSDLANDAIRGAWQPFCLSVAASKATLSYAGQIVPAQPTPPGNWQHPAIIRLGMLGPGRGVRFVDLRFAAKFASATGE